MVNASRTILDSPLSASTGNIIAWVAQPIYEADGSLDWDKTDWTNTITYRKMAEWVAHNPDSRMVPVEKLVDPSRPFGDTKVSGYAVQYADHSYRGWHTARHVTKEVYDYYKSLTNKTQEVTT